MDEPSLVCVIVGILKRVHPYIVVTVCVIVGILKRVDPYIVVTVCVMDQPSLVYPQ
jgi:hypothetical protein